MDGVNLSSAGVAVAAAMRGEPEAVRALWHEHRRWVAAILLAHKPIHADLEDLLQDVAMALVKNIGELRDAGNVKAWLRTVAINAARALARPGKNRPHLRLTSIECEPSVCEPDSDALDEDARRMLELLHSLPEGYREPLLLRAMRGMPARQIAAILGLTEMAVENRIARGRRMLRELAAGESVSGIVCDSTSPMKPRAAGAARA
jgi:RNA polymerase sigma-70 factor (ECF subfamily)